MNQSLELFGQEILGLPGHLLKSTLSIYAGLTIVNFRGHSIDSIVNKFSLGNTCSYATTRGINNSIGSTFKITSGGQLLKMPTGVIWPPHQAFVEKATRERDLSCARLNPIQMYQIICIKGHDFMKHFVQTSC